MQGKNQTSETVFQYPIARPRSHTETGNSQSVLNQTQLQTATVGQMLNSVAKMTSAWHNRSQPVYRKGPNATQ